MNEPVIRVGVVGAGANTRTMHIPRLQAIHGVEIVGVCNRTPASSERVARQFGIPGTYRHWREAVSDPKTQAILIGTWPYRHCPVTLAALEAGKHVLCEARMAMNAAEAHAMLDASQARPHLVAQIVPSPMTLGVDNAVKRLIAEGRLGDILAIDVKAGGAFLDREAPLHWRHNWDLCGYNTMSLGIWYEAIMRWVGHATRVTAMGKTFVKIRKDDTGVMRSVRIPEHLDVLVDMECGAQAHLQISGVTGLAGPHEVWLFGSEGTLRFCNDSLFLGRRGDAELKEVAIPPEARGRWRVEEEFINAIRGLEQVSHTRFEDGVKYMEFTEAVGRSMSSGQAISLPL